MLSADIDSERAVLNAELSTLLARVAFISRQLNKLCRINLLPAEVLTFVFRIARGIPESNLGWTHGLTNVCALWRDIIFSQSDFWTTIHLRTTRTESAKEVFRHSGTQPLVVHWHAEQEHTSLVMSMLPRIRELYIGRMPPGQLREFWERSPPVRAPLLKTLHVRCNNIFWRAPAFQKFLVEVSPSLLTVKVEALHVDAATLQTMDLITLSLGPGDGIFQDPDMQDDGYDTLFSLARYTNLQVLHLGGWFVSYYKTTPSIPPLYFPKLTKLRLTNTGVANCIHTLRSITHDAPLSLSFERILVDHMELPACQELFSLMLQRGSQSFTDSIDLGIELSYEISSNDSLRLYNVVSHEAEFWQGSRPGIGVGADLSLTLLMRADPQAEQNVLHSLCNTLDLTQVRAITVSHSCHPLKLMNLPLFQACGATRLILCNIRSGFEVADVLAPSSSQNSGPLPALQALEIRKTHFSTSEQFAPLFRGLWARRRAGHWLPNLVIDVKSESNLTQEAWSSLSLVAENVEQSWDAVPSYWTEELMEDDLFHWEWNEYSESESTESQESVSGDTVGDYETDVDAEPVSWNQLELYEDDESGDDYWTSEDEGD